jgi:hypothetical protein
MDKNSNNASGTGDASSYNFSNFFCHPDFLNGKSGSTLNLVFTGTGFAATQNNKSDGATKGADSNKKKDS